MGFPLIKFVYQWEQYWRNGRKYVKRLKYGILLDNDTQINALDCTFCFLTIRIRKFLSKSVLSFSTVPQCLKIPLKSLIFKAIYNLPFGHFRRENSNIWCQAFLVCYVLVFQVHHCLRQIPVANGNAFSFVDPSWQILQFFHTLHLIHFLEQHQYPLFSSRSRDIMEKNDMDSVTRIIGHTHSP